MSEKKQLTLGSLFDGIGGFPYAASFYGIRPLWASEIVPECVAVTRRHFPDMAHLGDITQLHGGMIPPVDILTFGSPCQGLSLAGRRLGLADERSGLFMEAIRIIREMQEATHGKYPQFAIFENVPGALSSNGRRDYQAVLEAFTGAKVSMPKSGRWANAGMARGRGVDLAWIIYDAQHFGTAQRRRRLFLVADFRDRSASEILFVPKSLRGYFEAGGTPRQGIAAFTESGAGAAGAVIEILNDQGGDSMTVERGGLSPTLRSQTHGNLPIVAAGFDLQQITSKTNRSTLKPVQPTLCGAGSPHVVTAPGLPPDAMVGINGNLAGTLLASYYKGTGMRCGRERDVVLCASSGQSHAEILQELSPTLNCASEQPYVVQPDGPEPEQPVLAHPQIAGTLCASGAGLSRPAGQGNELDFCVVSAGFKHKAGSQSGSIGFQEETAPTLLAGQQGAVMKAYVIGAYHSGGMLSDNPKSGFYEADTSRTLDLNGGNPCCNQGGVAVVEDADGSGAAAVDCRNLRETDEVSGTLLAKAATGGYSLNYQNPVRTGLCVRRLTPTEAERLQGYPDGWTESGADGRAISDTKRYQMLGNSVAVPCVAYIMQGIRDAVDGE